ncbi:hypothetical protein SASPL_154970 [Salvia splendens]|uniref:Uncharacterized protein n=2 Tax=Salvia splendens TaxID=180675 RepID=A0A8X8YZR7_SALSN|nr:hypothetical protein SASPL_154970 [Salvia splendens]
METESGHVHCFSNTDVVRAPINDDFSIPSSIPWGQLASVPDPAFLRHFLASYGRSLSQETALSGENSSGVSNLDAGKRPFEEQESAVEPQDLECIWGYSSLQI